MLHSKGLSLMWFFSWSLKASDLANLLKQIEHSYGFSLVWILSCLFKVLKCLKVLVQRSHLSFLSSTCSLLCCSKSNMFGNLSSQVSHSIGLFMWIFSCLVRMHLLLNVLRQKKHWWIFSSGWTLFKCLFNVIFDENDLEHESHLSFLSSMWFLNTSS